MYVCVCVCVCLYVCLCVCASEYSGCQSAGELYRQCEFCILLLKKSKRSQKEEQKNKRGSKGMEVGEKMPIKILPLHMS